MPFSIVRNDITRMNTDAIVNAANRDLLAGSGVCGAIFAAAGMEKLTNACNKIGGCQTGCSVITKGYRLNARYIIHTAGPVYHGGANGERELLYSCYKSALELAKKYKITSIAFPLISSGIYGYPKAEALSVATNAISEFLMSNDMDIYLVVYDKNAFEISQTLFSSVSEYIDETFIKEDTKFRYYTDAMADKMEMPCSCTNANVFSSHKISGNEPKLIFDMDKSFSEMLFELIDESGMTDAEVYKSANIDRKLFSKIRSKPNYKPSKTTAVALAVALRLDMDTARELIEKAGYSMTHTNKFDIIIEYFINRGEYDLFEINSVLFKFDQSLIGSRM